MNQSQNTPIRSSLKLVECTSCRDKVQATGRKSESFESQQHSSTPRRPPPRSNLNYNTVYDQNSYYNN